MKKFNSNKNIIITLIIIIILVFVITYTATQRSSEKKANPVTSFVNDIVGIVDKGVSAPLKWAENGVFAVNNLFTTYSENEKLKSKLDDYNNMQSKNADLERENAELKSQLGLVATLSNYEIVTANVITRSPDTWQDILIIDQGKTNGVEVNMPVMSGSNLVGRVIESNSLTAKVELLTSSNQNMNHFPVKITPAEGEVAYGLLGNWDEEAGAYVVSQLTLLDNIKEGDFVTTSGLGGNSPADLVVGKVTSVKQDHYGLDKEAYVVPLTTLYDIRFVTVVKRTIGSAE